ncbi:MAG: SDR family oxidoreductase [Armatimonadetes bacterium]|nr:SDR family oxidoreductase [Armatimonadota bacterium]
MDTGLEGKTALVTGGSSGIGLGIALALAEEGVNLAIASRNPDEAALDQVRAKGVEVTRIAADLSKEEEVLRMVKEAIAGLDHIDFYINNAAWTWHQPITKIDSESWYKTLNTNLSSCLWACREMSKYMISRRSGSIVIIGSTVRFIPAYKETSYRISKVGLKSLMQNLAVELAPHGIRVNMVTPGHYKTRMTGNIPDEIEEKLKGVIPLHRFGNPVEVGHAVAFLLSEKLSGYTTGGDLVIDGGLSMLPLRFMSEQEIHDMNL